MTLVYFAVFLVAAMAAGSTGALFKPGAWYEALAKPWWTPPDWAFPVVWTTLYVLIAWAGARVAGLPGAGLGLAFWALQMVLNCLWTPVFFGQHRMGLALLILALMWLAVGATIVSFWRMDWVAGAMLVPYLVWVTIAGALNYTVWAMNPGASGQP